MVRRILAASALLIVLTAGTAAAQDPVSPSGSVAPDVIVRPPAAPPASVGGITVLPNNLPRTGGDLDLELFAGAGLTAAGMALAVSARQRRRRLETTPTFS